MKNFTLGLGVGLLAAAMAVPMVAQSANVLPVEFKSQVDTRAAKVGDKVMVVTTADLKEAGKVVLPKGSKLTGEVTAVTAASGKGTSTLAITFSQAVTPKGQAVNVRGGISSVAAGTTDSQDFANQAGFEVAISPSTGGGTLLTSTDGNFKLENGRRVQVQLSQVGAGAMSTADKK